MTAASDVFNIYFWTILVNSKNTNF